MITGDLDRALSTEPSSAGTWRPAPAGADILGGGPGGYATSIAFRIARGPAGLPGSAAAALARRLDGLDWVAGTSVAGGYLTVAVSPAALAALAVRITQAGPGCVRSDALRGAAVTARAAADLAAARTWPQARARLTSHLTGRLAEVSGATVTWVDGDGRAESGTSSPVAEALAFAGPDAITLALIRVTPTSHRETIDPAGAAARAVGNPAYAVRYAHAHAASTLRQAADLGLGLGEAVGFQPWLLAHPSEQVLLYELSWLPERAAGAARRGQPGAFARYLERLADAYLSCQESCPAAWPGMAPPASSRGRVADPTASPGRSGPGRDHVGPAGTAAPGQPEAPPAGSLVNARLWLAAAARTALAAGLGLLGVDAPDRL